MNNLSRLLKQPLRHIHYSILIFALIVALIGFADSVYLTIEHFQGVIPPCSITGGCERVLTSSYASIFGIPTSILGIIYYLLILVGLFTYFESKNTNVLKWTFLFTTVGFGFSLWFVFLQIFVIHSYCAYCLGSAITSTLLFVTAMAVFSHQQMT